MLVDLQQTWDNIPITKSWEVLQGKSYLSISEETTDVILDNNETITFHERAKCKNLGINVNKLKEKEEKKRNRENRTQWLKTVFNTDLTHGDWKDKWKEK